MVELTPPGLRALLAILLGLLAIAGWLLAMEA